MFRFKCYWTHITTTRWGKFRKISCTLQNYDSTGFFFKFKWFYRK